MTAKLKRLIRELMNESQACSNYCYSLSANAGDALPKAVREQLIDAAARHDVAVHLLKEELKNH